MKRLVQPLMLVGAVLALIGAAFYITHWSLSPYMYTIGATMVALAQINSPIKTDNIILKRLRLSEIYPIRCEHDQCHEPSAVHMHFPLS